MFLELQGDETLGRNESRAVRWREFRDYCKLHIVAHYPAVLLRDRLTVLPVGRVGADDVGRRMKGEMTEAGMDVSFVTETAGARTLFSVCFLYPDGAGGILTGSRSASDRVEPADVEAVAARCAGAPGGGIALAAPEVPLAARVRLLELATGWGFFRAVAVRSGEVEEAVQAGLFRAADLVSLNEDEARTLAAAPAQARAEDCLDAVARRLKAEQPAVRIAVTAGRRGAHVWTAGRWTVVAPCPAEAVNTAGAGDAFLGGLLTAEAAGLPIVPDGAQLATLIASAKVTSRDTIHLGLNRALLRRHAEAAGFVPAPGVTAFLRAA